MLHVCVQSDLIKICLVCLTLIIAGSGWCIDEAWLFERYQSGDVDTIQSLLSQLPDTSVVGLFFKGVFETDGEAARYFYDRILALYPGSSVEPWALERLWQYHWSKGDVAQAERFYNFLQQRHPNHVSQVEKPDFKAGRDMSSLLIDTVAPQTNERVIKSGPWRVQVGAFSKRDGARKIARKVVQFGPVDLVDKNVNGRDLTVVMVGRLPSRREAEKLAEEIKALTGLKGIAVLVENN